MAAELALGKLVPLGLALMAMALGTRRAEASPVEPGPAPGPRPGPGPTPEPELPISTNQPSRLVREAQTMLAGLGYELGPGGIDSRWGPGTWSALNAFLVDEGEPRTSALTQEALDRLRAAYRAGHLAAPPRPLSDVAAAHRNRTIDRVAGQLGLGPASAPVNRYGGRRY